MLQGHGCRLAALAGLVAIGCGGGGAGDADAQAVLDGAPLPDAFAGPYDDFPEAPIFDPDGPGGPAPDNAGDLFGSPGTGETAGGPCLTEPEPGALFPKNWIRPRFSWIPGPDQNFFELRLAAASQTSELVVYTTATSWTMPRDMWLALTTHSVDDPIAVSLRGARLEGGVLTAGPALGVTGPFTIAPATASGAIVYWTTTGGSALRGFTIGEETVEDIVVPGQAETQCIGCHASTPDGLYVGFSASSQAGNGDPAHFGLRSVDGAASPAPFVSTAAQSLMAREFQQLPSFSAGHWRTGDRVGITTMRVGDGYEIAWTDLEAASADQGVGWGVLVRGGDDGRAASATFNHAGDRILYVSGGTVQSGVTVSDGDLMAIPYADRAGGTATPIPGASDPAHNEYYPALSANDKLIAYTRVPAGQSSYNNGNAELYVIGSDGGTPLRLAANDPPVCSGKTSPGVLNSWPKWSPTVERSGQRTFYWLTFSSTRSAGGNPQLYVTPVVQDETGLRSYPALYLWNQPAGENNHTPAWDVFGIE